MQITIKPGETVTITVTADKCPDTPPAPPTPPPAPGEYGAIVELPMTFPAQGQGGMNRRYTYDVGGLRYCDLLVVPFVVPADDPSMSVEWFCAYSMSFADWSISRAKGDFVAPIVASANPAPTAVVKLTSVLVVPPPRRGPTYLAPGNYFLNVRFVPELRSNTDHCELGIIFGNNG